jgi:mRNA interferase HigB
MNIYNKSTIVEFYSIHTNCKKTLENWYHDVSTKQWKKPNDIIKDYSKARTIKNDRAIFEINGSEYRLIAEINYSKGWLFIKFIGTHAEYDKVNAETIELY